jgi:hypothetical protein
LTHRESNQEDTMRKSIALFPFALLTIAAAPAAAQEAPLVLFCKGQCVGIDEAGKRVPVNKGTRLAPGLRLETGPDSYMQVRIGSDTACGIGENARVRFDRRVADRDIVMLDQGRIRLVGGEAIGRPATRPVELRTVEGNLMLRSADIEVKALPKTSDALPAPMLVKLNVGDARLGDLPVTRDAVQGVVGGKVLDRAIPIGDIALTTPRRDVATTAPSGAAVQPPAPTLVALPVANLPVTEVKPIATPLPVSPALTNSTLAGVMQGPVALASTGKSIAGVTPPPQPAIAPNVYQAAIVPASTLILATPITTSTGTKTTLNTIATTIQTAPTTTTSSTTTAPLSTTLTLQPTTTTTTSTTSILSPKLTTTILR